VHSVAELADKDQIVLCTMGNSVADVVSRWPNFANAECYKMLHSSFFEYNFKRET